MRPTNRQSGFTLIELVLAIVILSIGVTAFIALINQTVSRSADPMVISQANAIAQAYLEEIMLSNFCDPDLSADCPTFCTAANACTVCSVAESSRNLFDDVCDYNDPLVDSTTGAKDQNNNLITGLEAYNINVTVDDSGVTLNGLNSATGDIVRIDVNVTHDSFSDLNLTLSGYRTNF